MPNSILTHAIPVAGADLIAKYSGSGPRYTSYPTAVEFRSDIGADQWREALAEEFSEPSALARSSYRGLRDSISLYIHLPYCRSLCYFCACTKVISAEVSVATPYIESLKRELSMYREMVPSGLPVEQIHWGGGTPNFLPPDLMAKLHHATLAAFPHLTEDADVSIEIDPRTVTREQMRALRSLGFNRVSFGVQDFNPEVQRTINRIQSVECTRATCDWSREEGFSGINIDLIYGLPRQTAPGFSATLNEVLSIRPERIALYGYAHVTWMKKVQKVFDKAPLPSPDERIELLLLATRQLLDAGYVHIGMDHFALPDDDLARALNQNRLNRNFMGYTAHRGARILAFGASAISSLPGAFVQNFKEVDRYSEEISAGRLPIERGLRLNRDDRIRAEVIESIMCREPISIPAFERCWKISFSEYFRESLSKLAPLIDDGLVNLSTTELRITSLGALFLRNIAMCFDAYLEAAQNRSTQVFSKTV